MKKIQYLFLQSYSILTLFLLSAVSGYAQGVQSPEQGGDRFANSQAREVAQGFLAKINELILYPLIILLTAVALLVFLYGLFEYVKGAQSPGDRERGRRHILFGVIGMLIMLSAYAILTIAANTFDLSIPS